MQELPKYKILSDNVYLIDKNEVLEKFLDENEPTFLVMEKDGDFTPLRLLIKDGNKFFEDCDVNCFIDEVSITPTIFTKDELSAYADCLYYFENLKDMYKFLWVMCPAHE